MLALFSTSSLCLAEDYDELDERLRAIEERMVPVDEDDGQSGGGMLGLVGDVQRLHEEVRRLRGDIERLQFDAEQNRIRQRDMFIDMEKRLSALENGTAQGPVAVTAPQPGATVAPPVAAPQNPPQAGAQVIQPPVTAAGDSSNGAAENVVTPPPPAPAVNPAAAEQEAYLQAFEMLKLGRYDDSISAFQAFLQRFPDGDYADNARYWLAETHYVKKEYPIALEHFRTLLAEYPDSTKLPGALLKLGYIHYELGNNAEARIALERVRNEYASSSVADLAKQRLERMDREGR